MLSKIKEEQASGILVLPLWPTQPWFPVMLDLLVTHPRLIPPDSVNLQIKGKPQLLPPHKKLSLLVILLSGRLDSQTVAYRQALPNSYPMPGEKVPSCNMTTVRRWGAYCRKWKIDTFTPPIAAGSQFSD